MVLFLVDGPPFINRCVSLGTHFAWHQGEPLSIPLGGAPPFQGVLLAGSGESVGSGAVFQNAVLFFTAGFFGR